MWTLSLPTGRGSYSPKARKRPIRDSCNILRTSRSTGQPLRPRSEQIRIERRKQLSEIISAETDIEFNINLNLSYT
jgi:hypothetical protein